MSHRLQQVLVRQIAALTGRRGETDAALLRRFADDRDEAAFVELHRRHGPLVWAACRHLLANPADAEDAYQVTFLALVKSAGRVRNGTAVGAWLHGVAVRTASKLKRTAVRRRGREERAASGEADQTVTEAAWSGLLAAVHEEVEQLPEGLRTAFVLCDLQGVRQPDAAARLGWKPGTLTGRLTKARQQLLQRLQARGIAPTLATGVCGVAVTSAGAVLLPPRLTGLVHDYAVGATSAPAFLHRMAREVTTMQHSKWWTAGVLTVGALALWLGSLTLPTAGGQQPADPFSQTRYDRLMSEQQPGPWRYKYVPLEEGQTADSLTNTTTHLEQAATDGWEFCGSLDMQLRSGEYQALKAGKTPSRADQRGGTSIYRVLVFKRRGSETAAVPRFNRNPVLPLPSSVEPRQETARLPLQRANAKDVATFLSTLLKEPQTRLSVDERTNSLIISADAATIKFLRKALQEAEQAQDKHGNEPLLFETLRRSFTERLYELSRDVQPAPAENKKPSGKAPLLRSEDQGTLWEVYPLKWTSAEEVAKIVTQLYQKQDKARVQIIANQATNSIVIGADKETLQNIRHILEALDTDARKKAIVQP